MLESDQTYSGSPGTMNSWVMMWLASVLSSSRSVRQTRVLRLSVKSPRKNLGRENTKWSHDYLNSSAFVCMCVGGGVLQGTDLNRYVNYSFVRKSHQLRDGTSFTHYHFKISNICESQNWFEKFHFKTSLMFRKFYS